jgi:hypothetical protein
MSRPERQLRLVQGGEILFIVMCFFVKRIGTVESGDSISAGQWVAIVAAIWCGVSGFTLQRRVNRIETRPPKRARKSTPLGRWRAGHLLRLTAATAVGLWGLVLHYSRGPEWIVNAFLGLALLLLLIWMPGAPPASTQP